MDTAIIEKASTGEDLLKGSHSEKKSSTVGGVLKTMTIGVVGMLLAFQAGYFLKPGHPAEVIPYAVGRIFGPILCTAIIFGLFQIFRKFRTTRARWLIVFWVNAVLLLGAINQGLQAIMGTVQ